MIVEFCYSKEYHFQPNQWFKETFITKLCTGISLFYQNWVNTYPNIMVSHHPMTFVLVKLGGYRVEQAGPDPTLKCEGGAKKGRMSRPG